MKVFLALLAAGLACASTQAQAWEGHMAITRASLQSYDNWDSAPYEPIEKVLPVLSVQNAPAPVSLKEFAEQLAIHMESIKWDWQPSTADGSVVSALEVLVKASIEPDGGMDQNLNLSPDQKYMGGYEGLSSQAIRHMFFRSWSPIDPVLSFHVPLHEMGFAPDRAELFFNLAKQAKKDGHTFWAYRFLGWGLHYVQDLGQPYHTSQVGSMRLLPFRVLLSVGLEAFMAETLRIVGNFHLSFEQYADFLMNPDRDSPLALAFKVPKADEGMKMELEQKTDLPINDGVKRLALASQQLAQAVVDAQMDMMGPLLMAPEMNLISNFYDSSGKPKIDFSLIETSTILAGRRTEMLSVLERAFGNTGVATRWYVDRFRTLTAEMSK
ncbi:MAG: hypothetical protein HY074_19765 [Deltaproteobacteria bacterium]|nr:hypothetical protein [Deltaproteobacteria bacterium]